MFYWRLLSRFLHPPISNLYLSFPFATMCHLSSSHSTSSPYIPPFKRLKPSMANHRENPHGIGWVESSDFDHEVDVEELHDRSHAARGRLPPRRRISRGPVIRFNPQATHNYRRFLRNCLISTFFDSHEFTIRQMQAIVDHYWWLRGNVRVVGVSRNNFVFHFNNHKDRMFVLLDGPWSVHGGLLFLAPWEPNLVLTNYRVTEIPVWIQLWRLPLEFQNPCCGYYTGYHHRGLPRCRLVSRTPLQPPFYENPREGSYWLPSPYGLCHQHWWLPEHLGVVQIWEIVQNMYGLWSHGAHSPGSWLARSECKCEFTCPNE